jgi:ectoine hydroxylase-related dioxygenase (phytanoyl-CoA dioxygenase family)
MLELSKPFTNYNKVIDELLVGSGVVLFKEVFPLNRINEARAIVNTFADNQEQKESHFNAEAEASGKIHLQQRVWNLFGKGDVFSYLITNDIIFNIMSKLLGTEFICGSYCASRLLPGSPGQELHLDYPYWDFYKSETFPIGLNSSFAQNCQATIPLDVCSKESGATAYIPGSQKNLHYPNQNDDLSDKQQMIAEPGDLVFFNGNCWHGASPNNSGYQRAALLIEFLPKYIKPVEDLVSNLDGKFKNNCSDRVKQLLGFNYIYPKIMDVSKTVNDIGLGYKAE